MVTDGKETYTIFNMYDLNWAGSPYEGCDHETGLPKEGGGCTTAQVSWKQIHYCGIPMLKFPLNNNLRHDHEMIIASARF